MINIALKLIRIFHNHKLIELSKLLGISPSYLSEIENKKKKPSLEILNKYSKVYHIPSSAILFFSEIIEKEQIKTDTRLLMKKFLKIVEKFSSINNEF